MFQLTLPVSAALAKGGVISHRQAKTHGHKGLAKACMVCSSSVKHDWSIGQGKGSHYRFRRFSRPNSSKQSSWNICQYRIEKQHTFNKRALVRCELGNGALRRTDCSLCPFFNSYIDDASCSRFWKVVRLLSEAYISQGILHSFWVTCIKAYSAPIFSLHQSAIALV